MQITSGLISCDPLVNDSLVTGNSSVDWSQVTTNCILIVSGNPYTITAVSPVAKEITISPKWVGAAVLNVPYVIVRDFTLNMQLPLLNPGDLEAAAIFSRAMLLLDSIGASTIVSDPTVSDYPISQAHSFIVGNAVYVDGSTFSLASSATQASSEVIGVVSKVVDANNFWLRFSGVVGTISPITGITLVPGELYYLKESVTAGQANICTLASGQAGTTLIPIVQGSSATSAFLLTFSRASSSLFTATQPGLVPAPGSPAVGNRVLRDNGWDDSETLDLAELSGEVDALDLRVDALETSINVTSYTQSLYTRKSVPSGNWSWTKGAQTYAIVTIWCGEARGNGTPTTFRPNDNSKAILLPIASGVRFRLSLEGVTTLSGAITAYRTTLLVDGTLRCAIGWASPTVFVDQQASPWQSPIPYTFTLPLTRPGSPPYAFATQVTRVRDHMVGFHHPEYSPIDIAMIPFAGQDVSVRTAMAPFISSSGYYYASNPNAAGHFSGAVLIETGIGL